MTTAALTTEPTVSATEDTAYITFPSDGPIIAGNNGEKVRLVRVTIHDSEFFSRDGDLARCSGRGRGLIVRKDGSTGTAIRDFVRVPFTALPPGLLMKAAEAMADAAEKHAADVALIAEQVREYVRGS